MLSRFGILWRQRLLQLACTGLWNNQKTNSLQVSYTLSCCSAKVSLLDKQRYQVGFPQLLECIFQFLFKLNFNRPPQPSSKNPYFQNEAKCTTFLVKMSFSCMRTKNHFHIKGRALNLVLIQKFGGTQKWSITVKTSRVRAQWFKNLLAEIYFFKTQKQEPVQPSKWVMINILTQDRSSTLKLLIHITRKYGTKL